MTLITVLNVLYVLVAIAMVTLILMQRGAGAQAGSGFGAGASATVFGARGAASFLSRMTRWLAILFIGLSLAMGWVITHRSIAPPAADLGVMAGVSETDAPPRAPVPDEVPSAPIAPGLDVPPAPPAGAPLAPSDAAEVPVVPAPIDEADEKKDRPNR